MKTKILITGVKGIIGATLNRMLSPSHCVFGLDLAHGAGEKGWQQKLSKGEFTYARCDVGDFRQLERIFAEVGPFDFVYHTAGEFGRWNGEDFYEQVWRTNAIGTKNIIRLQEKYDFKLIHFSTSEVYGDYSKVMSEEVMDEIEVKQLNDYALSKWVNEIQIRNSRLQHNTQSVIVRLFNTYGPGEYYHPYRSIHCKLCYHALMGIPVVIYRGHHRSSIYIEDCCHTLVRIIDRFQPGETYNIGGLEHHSIEKLVDIIWDQTKADRSLITFADSEILTTKDKKVDCQKATRDLDHKTTISLEDGITRTLSWQKEFYGKKIP